MMRHIFATKAGKPKNKIIDKLGWIIVLILLAVVIGQGMLLMGFCEYDQTMFSMIRVAVLIFFECMMVPFVLWMKVSPGLRVVSMGSGRLIAISFLIIAIMICFNWLFVGWILLFAVMIGLVTWNRWPKDDLDRKRVRREQEKIFKQTYVKK